MLLVANLANTNNQPKKILKPWHMGTQLRGLVENYPVNTNMTVKTVFKNLSVLVLWTKIDLTSVGSNCDILESPY